jgi:hypothetical protein
MCRRANEIYGTEPNCSGCVPAPMPGNEDADRVFALCHDQVINGISGYAAMGMTVIRSYPQAIRIEAVMAAMDEYNIVNRRDCLDKVKVMFDAYREAIMDRQLLAGAQGN